MKIDFTKIKVQVSFDGTHKTFNIAKEIGNDMMYNGSVICDIGFEELARQIYFSDADCDYLHFLIFSAHSPNRVTRRLYCHY